MGNPSPRLCRCLEWLEDISRMSILKTLGCSTNYYIKPHIEYSVQAWSPWLRKVIKCPEHVRRRATMFKRVNGLIKKTYEERLQLRGFTTQTWDEKAARGSHRDVQTSYIMEERNRSAQFFQPAPADHNLGDRQPELFLHRTSTVGEQWNTATDSRKVCWTRRGRTHSRVDWTMFWTTPVDIMGF